MDGHDAFVRTSAAHQIVDQDEVLLHIVCIPEKNPLVFVEIVKVGPGGTAVKVEPVKRDSCQSPVAMRQHTVQEDNVFFAGGKSAPLIFEEHLTFSYIKQEKGIQPGPSHFVPGTAGIEGFQTDIKEVVFGEIGGGVDKDTLRFQNVLLFLNDVFFRDLPHVCSLGTAYCTHLKRERVLRQADCIGRC